MSLTVSLSLGQWCSDRQCSSWWRLRRSVQRSFLTCLSTSEPPQDWTNGDYITCFIWYGYACRAALIKEGDILVMPTSREHLSCFKRAWWSWIADRLYRAWNTIRAVLTPRMCLCCVWMWRHSLYIERCVSVVSDTIWGCM